MPTLTTRTRWLIGGGIAVAAVAVVAIAVFVLGARPVPEALKYLPADSVVVGELRADIPGDQLGHLGNLLAHFPGFKDQSTLATKLDQAFDRLLSDQTGGATSYTRDVKPWLAGPTFIGLAAPGPGATPPASPGAGTPAAMAAEGALLVATTDGSAVCERALAGSVGASETYLGVTITKNAGGELGCALDGRYALIGSPARIRAGLDAHRAGNGMDRVAQYAQARDALGGDRLATVYLSSAAAARLVAADPSLPISAVNGLAALPAWAIAGIRAEDDALVADIVVAPAASGQGGASAGAPTQATVSLPPPHASQVAAFVPGDAIALAELHGIGATAQNALGALRADPQFQSAAAQLDSALALAGGPEALVGWIDDAAIVVLPDHTGSATPGLTAGFVLVAHDDASAAAKATQLRSVLSLLALSSGNAPVDETIEGVTVTTIDLGDLGTLLNAAGGAGGLGSIGGLPIPTDAHVKLTIAARGRLLLFGGDDAFARAVLGVDAGSTLADQSAYRHAVARGAEQNLGQVYLAGAALRDLAGRFIPPDQIDRWRTDLLPYAAPVESLLITTTTTNGLSRTRIVVSVATPDATATGTP
ncbi:MAG TPA: DUF3352 domain-containing protein [Candidatus Acidoferrales bacterium]|nr:DUF3352 domain-containing protein [Candidatus Acidoferrales bacterium]